LERKKQETRENNPHKKKGKKIPANGVSVALFNNDAKSEPKTDGSEINRLERQNTRTLREKYRANDSDIGLRGVGPERRENHIYTRGYFFALVGEENADQSKSRVPSPKTESTRREKK